MRVQITARQVQVPAPVQARATELIEKLSKFDPNLLSADLTFRQEGVSSEIDGILSIARSDRVVATGSGSDFLSAADDLSDKLAKILRRKRSAARDRARSAAE